MSVPITSFYRLQFGGEMTFDRAAELAPYFADLGVSHLYASPIFEARSGSTHGYDVTDPNHPSTVLGGEEGFDRLSDALGAAGLGLMIDIVPNHMAASEENVYLSDILRRGRSSEHAAIFDIDWDAKDRVVLPILGGPLEEVLERGELTLSEEKGERQLAYFDRRFPLRQGTEHLSVRELVDAQHYRLVHWRDLGSLNYRRFFDISDLIGVRQEDEAVFRETHRFIESLVREGRVQALRVDHIDGLRDPRLYLERLATFFGDVENPPIYVEKILEGHEVLPPEWKTRGETGYWFLGRLDRVFMNPDADMGGLAYADRPLADVLSEAKRHIMTTSFGTEFERMATDVGAETHRLEALAGAFPVYRTYLSPDAAAEVNERERRMLKSIAQDANEEELAGILADPQDDRALRFQQMTGPVMAKALEDTTFYRRSTNLALNEVGADPSARALTPDSFLEDIRKRMGEHPFAMNALSTHDTKRSEDARARLVALSWADEEHRDRLARLAGRIADVGERPARHLVQAALAAWPLEEESDAQLAERLKAYIVKAEREAKCETSWTDQNEEYEEALGQAVNRLLSTDDVQQVATAIEPDVRRIVAARTVLKLTLPGIPDTYQNTERRFHRLVDPDNRALMQRTETPEHEADREKNDITRTLLRLRREVPGLFLRGGIERIEAPEGVLAFTRQWQTARLSVAATITRDAQLPALEGEPLLDLPGARVALRLGN